MFNLDPPPGFRGFDPERAVEIYQRHLPHWRQDGATYAATFRLNDSLPPSRQREIRELKETWEQINKPPFTVSQLMELHQRIQDRDEQWLDQGLGRCVLREPSAALLVSQAMHFLTVIDTNLIVM